MHSTIHCNLIKEQIKPFSKGFNINDSLKYNEVAGVLLAKRLEHYRGDLSAL